MQPRKRNRKSKSRQSVGLHDRDEGVSIQEELVDESNLVDITMMCAEEAIFGSEVPIIVSVEDTNMFTQDTQLTQVSEERTEETKEESKEKRADEGKEDSNEESKGESEEQSKEVSEEETVGTYQRTKQGVRICYGPPPSQKKGSTSVPKSSQVNPRPKLTIQRGPSYATRSKTTFKSVFFGNDDEPIDIE
ncbi:unnamed protein product [Cuscuta epithymum]|uniref:Uncharacterized protein n=1 Tax=Cuscuta epithymum TaxID=186058 RepID=A0AAV0EXK2_9ASTE|nr:unnamed protein product [Cuscuta epithymum]